MWWLFGPTVVLSSHVGPGPCDVYEAAGTPCVAAHSMVSMTFINRSTAFHYYTMALTKPSLTYLQVRAMYAQYKGPLYNIMRTSDNATLNISVVNGFADAEAQV